MKWRYSHLSHFDDKGSLVSSPVPKKGAKAKTSAKKHTMSAEGRAKIAAAAKKRWKAWKAAKKKAAKS